MKVRRSDKVAIGQHLANKGKEWIGGEVGWNNELSPKRGQLAASLCFRYPAPARQHETLRWWREIKEADNAPSFKCISGYSTSITDAKVLPKAPNFVANIIIINISFHIFYIFHIIPDRFWEWIYLSPYIHIIPNHFWEWIYLSSYIPDYWKWSLLLTWHMNLCFMVDCALYLN